VLTESHGRRPRKLQLRKVVTDCDYLRFLYNADPETEIVRESSNADYPTMAHALSHRLAHADRESVQVGVMEKQNLLSGPVQTLVYPSIGHAELGRLLRKHGYDAEAIEEDGRSGYRTLSQPRFTAWLQTPFDKRPGEFAAIFLWAAINLPAAVSAEVIQTMRWKTMYAHVNMNPRGRLTATYTLVVSGGITEYYLRNQIWHWARDLELIRNEVRKQLRLVLGRTVH
jgi:hypothetical protein